MTRDRKTLLLVSAFAAGAVLAPLAVAAPAQAASWTTLHRGHGAQFQACKVPLDQPSRWRVKVRLVNDSAHGHTAGISVVRNGTTVDRVDFRILERRTSKVRSVVTRGGDELIAGMGEAATGEGAGGDVSIGSIGRC